MPKSVAVNFSAQESTPERAIRNVTTKINEYLDKNPGSRAISVSHSVSGRLGALAENPRLTGDLVAHAIVIFETS